MPIVLLPEMYRLGIRVAAGTCIDECAPEGKIVASSCPMKPRSAPAAAALHGQFVRPDRLIAPFWPKHTNQAYHGVGHFRLALPEVTPRGRPRPPDSGSGLHAGLFGSHLLGPAKERGASGLSSRARAGAPPFETTTTVRLLLDHDEQIER